MTFFYNFCARARFKARYYSARARKIIFKARNEFAIVENIYLDTSHDFFLQFLCARARALEHDIAARVHVSSSNYS